MDAIRSLAAARWSADRRVRLAVTAVVLPFALFVAVLAGAGARAVFAAAGLLLAALPWVFASAGRAYLLDDAMEGVPFAWRGERAGVWATAPVAGFLIAGALVGALGLPGALALLACPAGAAAYTCLLFWAERRHERAGMLELTVLEQRFERIARRADVPGGEDESSVPALAPAPRFARPAPSGATEEWTPDFADDRAG